MTKKDYYKVLGLSPDCKPQDIKKNYHNLALKYHPDKQNNKSDVSSKFHEIQEAYKALIDPKQRQIYDKYGYKGLQQFQDRESSGDNKSIFFSKGFQGTDKSAFEVLCDILLERDDDDDSFSQNYRNSQISEEFESNVTNLIEDFTSPSDAFDDDFFSNYSPTFEDPNFLTQASMLRSSTSSNNFKNQNLPQGNTKTISGTFKPASTEFQNHFFKTSFSQSPSHSYSFSQQSHSFSNYSSDLPKSSFKPHHSPIITVENEHNKYTKQPLSFLASEINEFQSFLNEFHSHLEESFYQKENLNPKSKKINKLEKMFPSPLLKKKIPVKRYNDTSVPIFS